MNVITDLAGSVWTVQTFPFNPAHSVLFITNLSDGDNKNIHLTVRLR